MVGRCAVGALEPVSASSIMNEQPFDSRAAAQAFRPALLGGMSGRGMVHDVVLLGGVWKPIVKWRTHLFTIFKLKVRAPFFSHWVLWDRKLPGPTGGEGGVS